MTEISYQEAVGVKKFKLRNLKQSKHTYPTCNLLNHSITNTIHAYCCCVLVSSLIVKLIFILMLGGSKLGVVLRKFFAIYTMKLSVSRRTLMFFYNIQSSTCTHLIKVY